MEQLSMLLKPATRHAALTLATLTLAALCGGCADLRTVVDEPSQDVAKLAPEQVAYSGPSQFELMRQAEEDMKRD